MSMGITIDINGVVIERIQVQQTLRLDDDPLGKRGYTVTELPVGTTKAASRAYKDVLRHRRKDGALHLAASVCEFLSQNRKREAWASTKPVEST